MSRLMFTKLPITVDDATLPILSSGQVTELAQYEYSALGHWIFNRGGVGNFIDVTRYGTLTQQSGGGAEPAVHYSNYMLISAALGEAYETEFGVADCPAGAMTVVVRANHPGTTYPSDLTPDYPIVCGNHEGTGGTGGMLYILTNGTIAKHTVAGKANAQLTTALTLDHWYYIGVAWTAAGINIYLGLSGGSEYVYAAGANPMDDGGDPFAIGNNAQAGTAYDSGEYGLGEFILFDEYKDEAAFDALYARAKARMLTQGITIE